MSNPFDRFDAEPQASGGLPDQPASPGGYARFNQLPARAEQTPEESAQTQAIESRDWEKNVERINQELARKGLSPDQKSVLEQERQKLMMLGDTVSRNEPSFVDTNANPFDQFDTQESAAPKAPEAPKGFLGTLKDPWTLWTEESLPAHLVSAYQKGVFDKPMGELVHGASEAIKDFSVKELWAAAQKDPGRFAGELVNSLVADPYLLLAPVGLGGKLASSLGTVAGKLGTTAARAAIVGGRAAEAGVVGGALAAPVSAAEQLDRQGFIDPAKLSQDMKVGAGMSAGIAGVLTLAGRMSKAKVKPSDLADEVKFKVGEGEDPMQAVLKTLKEHGIEDSTAQKMAEPLRDEQALEALAARQRVESGQAPGFGEEPSALAARAKLLQGKKTLTPAEARELVDIKTYLEVRPDLEATTPAEALGQRADELKKSMADLTEKIKSGKLSETDLRGIQEQLEGFRQARLAHEATQRGPELPAAGEGPPTRAPAEVPSSAAQDFERMRKELAPQVPPLEPIAKGMTPRQTREDLGRMARELAAARKAGELSEADFAKMTEGLKAQEAERLKPPAEPPPELPTRTTEQDFEEMRRVLAPDVPPLPPVTRDLTPRQAQADLGKMARELKAARETGELSERGFAQMIEDLQASEQARLAQEALGPPAPPEAPYPNQAAAEAAAAQERIAGGVAKGFGEEPSAMTARLAVLRGKRNLSPSEAREIVDIHHYLDLAQEAGATSAEAAAMTPSQAKRWLESRLAEVPLDTAIKIEEPKLAKGQIGPGMRQRGVLDPEMGKWLAAGLGGAALGGYLSDDKAKGAAIGAALILGGPLALRVASKMVKGGQEKLAAGMAKFESFKRNPKIAQQIDEVMGAWQGVLGTQNLAAARFKNAIRELVPDAARREALAYIIEDGNIRDLKGNERIAAELYQKTLADQGALGQKAGVLDTLIDDGSYVTHWVKNSKDIGNAKSVFSGVSPKSGFAERRTIPSLRKADELGIELVSKDIGDLGAMYLSSTGKSIGNKGLLDYLKSASIEGSDPILELVARRQAALKAAKTPKQRERALEMPERPSPVMPSELAPNDYKAIAHPQLQGMKVHPEMYTNLKHAFYSTEVPAWLQAATAISATAKQGMFGLSLFHANSLVQVAASAALGARKARILSKIPEMAEMLKKGVVGDFAHQMIEDGMEIGAHGYDMDFGAFAKLANSTTDLLDRVPGVGKVASAPIKGVKQVGEAVNKMLWENLHPVAKLSTAHAFYTSIVEAEAKKAAATPSYQPRAPKLIRQEVAGVVNDLFGGQNWRKISNNVQNKWLHDFLGSMVTPEGKRYTNLAALALDWGVSSVRAGYKGAKSTIKTVIPGARLTDAERAYRQYFVGSSLMAATIMEGIQQGINGKHFWNNKDPTTIELSDGRKIQPFKHYMEGWHALADPRGFLVNKLGYLPKETMSQLFNKEYMSTKGMPEMGKRIGSRGEKLPPSVGERVVHAGKGMLPINVQELLQGKPETALAGTLGIQVMGKSREERSAISQKAAERAALRRRYQRGRERKDKR